MMKPPMVGSVADPFLWPIAFQLRGISGKPELIPPTFIPHPPSYIRLFRGTFIILMTSPLWFYLKATP